MWLRAIFKAKTHNTPKCGIFPNLREEGSFSCAMTQDIVVTISHIHNIYGKIEKTSVISCPEAFPASPKRHSLNHNIYGQVVPSTTRYMKKHEQMS